MEQSIEITTKFQEHRFGPVIFPETTKLIVGTAPPDGASFYFSNSSKTRLWDILKTISENKPTLCKGSYLISEEEKRHILKSLNLGLCDIIKKFVRTKADAVDDKYLIPIEYFNLPEIIKDTKIDTLIFVYQSAARMFLHSLEGGEPKPLSKLTKYNPEYGEFHSFIVNGRTVNCILLPNPLNRGKKGETLMIKYEIFKVTII